MSIPGSQYLGIILHVFSQSLLIPVILGLLFFLGRILMELGGLLGEWKERKKVKEIDYRQLKYLADAPYHNVVERLESLEAIPQRVKLSLLEIRDADYASRRVLAGKVFDEEEERALATLEKTELIAKLGPMFGLMGTLIPLGPGLAALGAGDLNALAQAIVIAFDTTVAGLAVGGLAFWISKIRRRWYTKELCILEDVLELVLGVNENATTPSKTAFVSGGRH